MDEATLEKLFAYIDEHKGEYINELAEVVAIPSVSGDPAHREDCYKMGDYLAAWIERLGGIAQKEDIGTQENGLKLPNVILGHFDVKAEKTVCIYGHYDVQPALIEDGWDSEPFKLSIRDGKMFGRGSSDDKGPVIGWLILIEAMKALNIPLPVNIKLVLEGMEESGSEGLEELIYAQADKFLKDVDYVCISDNYWLGREKPCLTYGLRGLCYFFVEVTGSTKDLHSGVYGGVVQEAMSDLVDLLGKLVNKKGEILIPGVMDSVRPVTKEEEKLYPPIDFNVEEFCEDAGLKGISRPIHEKKEDVLMHRWRFPSLSLHGIEGAFSGAGAKTVIPRKVIGKFSIRLVPDQNPDEIEKLTIAYLEKEFEKLNSSNSLRVYTEHSGKPWISDPNHPNFVAGRKAVERVWGITPDLTREGGSIPITLVFEDATKKNVLLLPMGQGDDGAHSQNEKLSVRNYIEGIKTFGVYINEICK